MKCTPEDITSDFEIVKNLRVCDKHYGSLSPRGRKPAKGKSSSRSRSNAQRGILKSTPCIVTCSQCNNKVCLTSDVPCKKHNISIFNNKYSVAWNFLDEINDKTTDLHNDLYLTNRFHVAVHLSSNRSQMSKCGKRAVLFSLLFPEIDWNIRIGKQGCVFIY